MMTMSLLVSFQQEHIMFLFLFGEQSWGFEGIVFKEEIFHEYLHEDDFVYFIKEVIIQKVSGACREQNSSTWGGEIHLIHGYLVDRST